MNVLRQNMTRNAVAKARDGNLEINIRNVAMFLPGPTAFDPALAAQGYTAVALPRGDVGDGIRTTVITS